VWVADGFNASSLLLPPLLTCGQQFAASKSMGTIIATMKWRALRVISRSFPSLARLNFLASRRQDASLGSKKKSPTKGVTGGFVGNRIADVKKFPDRTTRSPTSVSFPAADEGIDALGEFAGVAAFEHGETW